MFSNRNKLVGLAATTIAVSGVLLASALAPSESSTVDAGYSGSLLPPNVPMADFRLKDEAGAPISLANLKGSPSVVTFLYTNCRDICPLTAQQIRGALDQLGRDIPVIAITADPKGDTPAAVGKWLAVQQMRGRMHWALGTEAQATQAWNSWGVAGQTTKMDHSAYVFVLDRDGRRCVSWPTAQLTPEGLAHDLKLLGSRDGVCRG